MGEPIRKHKFLKEQVKNKLLIGDSTEEAYFFRIGWSKKSLIGGLVKHKILKRISKKQTTHRRTDQKTQVLK